MNECIWRFHTRNIHNVITWDDILNKVIRTPKSTQSEQHKNELQLCHADQDCISKAQKSKVFELVENLAKHQEEELRRKKLDVPPQRYRIALTFGYNESSSIFSNGGLNFCAVFVAFCVTFFVDGLVFLCIVWLSQTFHHRVLLTIVQTFMTCKEQVYSSSLVWLLSILPMHSNCFYCFYFQKNCHSVPPLIAVAGMY